MKNKSIHLVCEDNPSFAVAYALLSVRPDISVQSELGGKGAGNIKSNILKCNLAAQKGLSFLVLTDLDRLACPQSLINQWFASTTIHPNLLFRIVVTEIESWIMADRKNFARFMGISIANVPLFPDTEPDPKQTLINLARKSSIRAIKTGILPKDRFSHQGPEYVVLLTNFVKKNWDLDSACENSPSLLRAKNRLISWR